MRTEPTFVQKIAIGVVAIVVAGALGLWLQMSYFGIWTSDAKVALDVPELGDSMGPGAKVRYHGIIVGRVLSIEGADGDYRVRFLVDKEHAESIPDDATARVLPSTAFGSEYVELLADGDATDGNHLRTGTVLQADESIETLRLMDSFEQVDTLLSAIDVEDIDAVTGKLAPALDGNGADIKAFLERADATVRDLNADLPTVWETLRLTPPALDTVTDITPDLVSAMENSQTTADTIVETEDDLATVLDQGTQVVERGERLIEANRDVLVPFVSRLERLTGLAADNAGNFRTILTEFARTANNGAAGVDDNAIQMIGTIGLESHDVYTAEDCARYGERLIATNCGGPLPAPEPEDDAAAEAAAVGDLQDILSRINGGGERSADASSTTDPRPSPSPSPDDSTRSGGLLGLLFGGGR